MEQLSPLQPQSPVTKVRLPGDASSRSYYRLTSDNQSYVLSSVPLKDPETYYSFIELQQFLIKKNVPVPQIISCNPKKHAILQTDLGDTRLYDLLQNRPRNTVEHQLEKAVDLLLYFQEVTQTPADNVGYIRSFDFEKLSGEMRLTFNTFFRKLLQLHLDAEGAAVFSACYHFFQDLCQRITGLQYTLAHRDFHTKNVMVKDNEFFMIDFQDARLGPFQYDLVSLLNDAYFPLAESQRQALVNYYYNRAISQVKGFSLINPSKSVFLREYTLVALQRLFKVLGSFALFYLKDQDPRFLQHMLYALTQLQHFIEIADLDPTMGYSFDLLIRRFKTRFTK